jgi:hypothetical protein
MRGQRHRPRRDERAAGVSLLQLGGGQLGLQPAGTRQLRDPQPPRQVTDVCLVAPREGRIVGGRPLLDEGDGVLGQVELVQGRPNGLVRLLVAGGRFRERGNLRLELIGGGPRQDDRLGARRPAVQGRSSGIGPVIARFGCLRRRRMASGQLGRGLESPARHGCPSRRQPRLRAERGPPGLLHPALGNLDVRGSIQVLAVLPARVGEPRLE